MKKNSKLVLLSALSLFLLLSSNPDNRTVLVVGPKTFGSVTLDKDTERALLLPVLERFRYYDYTIKELKAPEIKARDKEAWLKDCREQGRKAGAVQVIVIMISQTGGWYVLEIASVETETGLITTLLADTYPDSKQMTEEAEALASTLPVWGTMSLGNAELSLWSFTNELERPVEYFEERNPGIKIHLTIIPTEQYPGELHAVMKSGKKVPDLFTAEAAFLDQFIASGYFEYLDQAPYNADPSGLVPYTVERGRDNAGRLVALTWQINPGLVFYRRGMARKYLGTDDPAEVARHFDTWEHMIEAGAVIRKKSGGKVYLLADWGDLENMVLAQREMPWVVNNRLVIDRTMTDYFDIAKRIWDIGLVAGHNQWSEEWFSAMESKSNVFCYLLPTWGLHYVMKPNAPDSSGDWGACTGPVNWYWGGTWLGINKKSTPEKKMAAWHFIRMMTMDPEFLEWWVKETGDNISNIKVTERIKGRFSEPYLDGQNHYALFYEASQGIIGGNTTEFDSTIDELYFDCLNRYAEGSKTRERALADFKAGVKEICPGIIIE